MGSQCICSAAGQIIPTRLLRRNLLIPHLRRTGVLGVANHVMGPTPVDDHGA